MDITMTQVIIVIAVATIFFLAVWRVPANKFEESESKPKRARNKKGQLMADDKSTPNVNEAWVGGKAPKRRGRPKGSKNKPKATITVSKPKRGRGRPKGSKNKVK